MIEAIIFDVDGTLAETEEAHRAAFNAAFRDRGLDWHWDRALYGRLLQVAGGKERLRAFMAETELEPAGGEPLDAFVAELHRAKTRHYTAAVAAGELALRPGVAQLIEECRRSGVRLAIATTTSPENVAALLAVTLGPDGPGLFEVIAAGDSVAAKKPAPDVYLAALGDLATPAGACLAIEDSAIGLRAALGAGIATLVAPSAYTGDDDFSGALLVTPNLTALAAEPGGSILPALDSLMPRS